MFRQVLILLCMSELRACSSAAFDPTNHNFAAIRQRLAELGGDKISEPPDCPCTESPSDTCKPRLGALESHAEPCGGACGFLDGCPGS